MFYILASVLVMTLLASPCLHAREGSNFVPGRDPVQAQVVAANARLQFQARAEQGDMEAQTHLGEMYEHGKGGSKDPVQAMAWYQKAAEQEYSEAQVALGKMAAKGVGMEKNPAIAAIWYRRAALQGNPKAQGLLGLSYMKGTGVARDDIEALMWFTLGSTKETAEVYWARKTILVGMSKDQVTEAKKRASEFVAKKETQKDASSPATTNSDSTKAPSAF